MIRWIIGISALVVVIAGIVGVYRLFITPKHLVVHGHSFKKSMIHKNAVEAFMIEQDSYQAYLKKTDHQWFNAVIIDIHEGKIAGEEEDSQASVTRLFFKPQGSSEILSGYLPTAVFKSHPYKMKAHVRIQLGSEFCELSNYTPKIDFSSQILQIQRWK